MEDASPFSSSLIPCTSPGCPLMGITQDPTTVAGALEPPQAANTTAMTAMLMICFFMMSFYYSVTLKPTNCFQGIKIIEKYRSGAIILYLSFAG